MPHDDEERNELLKTLRELMRNVEEKLKTENEHDDKVQNGRKKGKYNHSMKVWSRALKKIDTVSVEEFDGEIRYGIGEEDIGSALKKLPPDAPLDLMNSMIEIQRQLRLTFDENRSECQGYLEKICEYEYENEYNYVLDVVYEREHYLEFLQTECLEDKKTLDSLDQSTSTLDELMELKTRLETQQSAFTKGYEDEKASLERDSNEGQKKNNRIEKMETMATDIFHWLSSCRLRVEDMINIFEEYKYEAIKSKIQSVFSNLLNVMDPNGFKKYALTYENYKKALDFMTDARILMKRGGLQKFDNGKKLELSKLIVDTLEILNPKEDEMWETMNAIFVDITSTLVGSFDESLEKELEQLEDKLYTINDKRETIKSLEDEEEDSRIRYISSNVHTGELFTLLEQLVTELEYGSYPLEGKPGPSSEESGMRLTQKLRKIMLDIKKELSPCIDEGILEDIKCRLNEEVGNKFVHPSYKTSDETGWSLVMNRFNDSALMEWRQLHELYEEICGVCGVMTPAQIEDGIKEFNNIRQSVINLKTFIETFQEIKKKDIIELIHDAYSALPHILKLEEFIKTVEEKLPQEIDQKLARAEEISTKMRETVHVTYVKNELGKIRTKLTEFREKYTSGIIHTTGESKSEDQSTSGTWWSSIRNGVKKGWRKFVGKNEETKKLLMELKALEMSIDVV
jgi:hypothetical protein